MSSGTVVLNTVFSLFLAVDLVGNTMVLQFLSKNLSIKPATKYLLINLAVADLMVGIFFAPGVLLMPMSSHPTGAAGDVLCKIITGKNLGWLASLGSAFTLVILSIERFYAIVHPLRIRKTITTRKIVVLIPTCWILATVLTIPSFIADRFVEESHSCNEGLPRRWQNVLYSTVWTVSAGLIPVGTMITLYSIVFYSLWFKNDSSGNESRQALINARKKITKMMLTVSVIYALCCLPTHILYSVEVVHPNPFQGSLLFPVSYILVVLNSSANPFIYSFHCKEFRKCFKKMISCKAPGVTPSNETVNDSPKELRTAHTMNEYDTRL